jgi:Zn ribbon nucleic-acid-binding protein
MANNGEIIHIMCLKCGCKSSVIKHRNDGAEYGMCIECGNITYECKSHANSSEIADLNGDTFEYDYNSVVCPQCGKADKIEKTLTHGMENIRCLRCGRFIAHRIVDEKAHNAYSRSLNDVNRANAKSNKPTITCPYCHSTNTKKISGLSKAAGIAAFGLLALGRSTKQWHCNNCKSDF